MWVPKYFLSVLFYSVSNLHKIRDTISALGKTILFCGVNQREGVCPGLLISSIYLACSFHLAEKENGWCEVGNVKTGSDVHQVHSPPQLQLPGADFSNVSLWTWMLQCVCHLELVAAATFSLEYITKCIAQLLGLMRNTFFWFHVIITEFCFHLGSKN